MAITVTPQSINPNDPNPKQPGFLLKGTGDANEYSTAPGTLLAMQDGTTLALITPSNPLPSQLTDGTTKVNVIAATHALKIDVASVNGTATTGALALDASVNGILVTQGSTTSGQSGPLLQAAVTTSAPAYTTAQTSPLSLTPSGGLRTDHTTIKNTTVSTSVGASDAGTQRVASLIHDGTTTAGVVVATTALKVDIASVNGTATTAALALNSSVTGLQVTQGSTTSGQSGSLVQGAVTTGNPTYTTAQTDPLSLTTSGSLRTDITTINGGTAITLGMGAVTNAMRVAAVIGDGVNVPSVNAGTTKALYTTINDGTTTAAVATGGGLKVAPITQTSGGLSIQSNTALTNSAVAIKASAGQIYAWDFFNPAAATTYIQIFNVASGSVTLGTTPPTHVVGVAAGGKATFAGSFGIAFGTAISYAATTTPTGSTAPVTAAVCAVFYA